MSCALSSPGKSSAEPQVRPCDDARRAASSNEWPRSPSRVDQAAVLNRPAREEPITTYDVCRIPIAATTVRDAVATIIRAAQAQRPYKVHLCNAYTLSLVARDAKLHSALTNADLNLPDGTPVAWCGRSYGVRGPVRGPSLVTDVTKNGVGQRLRHYLYGGAPGIAERMADRLTAVAPGVEFAGVETPPYHDLSTEELRSLADRITISRSSIVGIGLGTPRQDYLVHSLGNLVNCPVVPVGAAFDFLSGSMCEAPKFLHGTGLEWLYRLRAEPRRLWKRYLLGNPRFVWQTIVCQIADAHLSSSIRMR
jgi:N-acetylglucosaminyldiphosphoundecaprenol N-acetyl-beta-D-mannosaminyltransferase